MRVLIADEDPAVRRLLSRLLVRDFDCAVIECADGLEVLDVLSRTRIDLLLLDLVLPLVDGFEVLAGLRSSHELTDLPVVVLSSLRREGDVRRAIGLGVRGYIVKPIRPSDIAERLAAIVSTLSPAAASRPPRTLRGLQQGNCLLLVDADRDYRHFVRSVLGHEYLVAEAESGAQGLKHCLRHPPAAILLGHDLGILGRSAFLRKLRESPELAGIPVVLTATTADESPGPDADATIPRSFIPAVLQARFAELVAPEVLPVGVLASRPDLWRQTLSATEQVFGMMLGLPVYADSVAVPSVSEVDDLAFITLTVPSVGALSIGITSPRPCSERMTQAFLQSDSPVQEEDVSGTLQELANMIGGRVLDALRAKGDAGRMGLPVVATADHDASPLAGSGPRAAFSDATNSLRFTVAAADLPAGAADSP